MVFRDFFKDIENDNLALISAKYEHVKSKLRNHGFVKLCYHQRLDDGRIIVLSLHTHNVVLMSQRSSP
ncbi:hypothetical protein NC651_007873 [Populus alba x Populus x berolinensis]|nr:hypothetical protein NC651_007873 [Populus alba x Populus x berolinensis]